MRNKDHRRAKRDPHDSAIELFKAGKLIAVGRLVDFSMSGASFRAELLLAVGDPVRARLRLLEKGTLDISGRVVWSCKKNGANLYGVRFDSIKTVYPTGELKRPLI